MLLGCALIASRAMAEDAGLHYQATVAVQAHPSFPARYSGRNSMSPKAESATSVVMDLSGGLRLWRGAEVYLQPELAGGRGLSSTLGTAAFPSGEVYRVGNPDPTIILARVFLRHVIGLGGGRVPVEPGMNQLAGERAGDALTLTAGKFAVTDSFDNVPYSNDPHTHFMSWGLWASAAYDYPADTRGYTWGATADLSIDWWSARAGIFLEPKGARWGRPDDEAGAAVVVSGLSALHRRYLAAGGYGFLIGDGALTYGHEILGEVYYRLAFTKEVSVGGNYQPVINPAFNRDRGPIHIFTARAHVAF